MRSRLVEIAACFLVASFRGSFDLVAAPDLWLGLGEQANAQQHNDARPFIFSFSTL